MAVIYEVNLWVQRRLEAEYRAWLHLHVAKILHLPGFLDACVYEVGEAPADAEEFALCVHYRLRDDAALQTYLDEHAPRLRAEGVAKFGDGFRAQRRVLRELARY
jgi:hypothetical protein